jgi:hypothetical protein
MFSCDSIDMMRSMCYLLLRYFSKMCRFRLKYSTRSETVPRLIPIVEFRFYYRRKRRNMRGRDSGIIYDRTIRDNVMRGMGGCGRACGCE